MNFQALPVVPTSQEILERAFGRARKRGEQLRSSRTRIDKLTRARRTTLEKLKISSQLIQESLLDIIKEYPDFENLPEFYEELCRNQLDIDLLRESFGRLQGTANQVQVLVREIEKEVKATESASEMKSLFNRFYGRVSSSVKRVSSALDRVAEARAVMTLFPAIKDDHFTVALAGFPNVGKSTLLSQLTSAKPKIANYAFTTKTLNVGYYKIGYHDIQVIDTPGTLARFEKMNAIEQMAYLTLKYVADVIVMVFDPTGSYSQVEQEKLLAEVQEHDKPILFYISKTDIADQTLVAPFSQKYDACVSVDELKSLIAKEVEH